MRPYNSLVHPRSWRAFMEYGNGIVGDMCIHMFDMARWMMDLGWPHAHLFTGRHSGGQSEQGQYLRYADRHVRLSRSEGGLEASHLGRAPDADPKYPWGATFYGDKGTLKAGVYGYDFIPEGKGEKPIHKDVSYEFEQYPEDKTEKDLERHVAPAIRGHMRDLLAAIDQRGKPVADIEQGYISTASCILANLSMQLGRDVELGPGEAASGRRCRSQPPAAPALPQTVGASGSGARLGR